jgi:hypothetical protein
VQPGSEKNAARCRNKKVLELKTKRLKIQELWIE